MLYTRQSGLISVSGLKRSSVSIIGSGSTGSFTALGLSKMGVGSIEIFDEDGVSEHNLPNQFFRHKDIGQFKVDALKEIIKDFGNTKLIIHKCFYTDQLLQPIVITCTDSLESRKIVWERFLQQHGTQYFIDGRMGGEFAHVYCVNKKDIEFYEKSFLKKAENLPCSERSIIYCVMIIAGLLCRTVKAIINNEKDFPKEIMFSMKNMVYIC